MSEVKENLISIDHEASEELKNILASNNLEASVIRIFISGMGCGGINFNLAQDEEKDDDVSIDFEGIKYVVSKDLVEEFEGFDIIYFDNFGYGGLVVKPRKVQETGGCAGCSRC